MKDLKECPFCGSTDLNTSYINAIYCKSCEGGVDLGVYHGNKTQQFTIEAWNHRTSIPISKLQEFIDSYRATGFSNIVDVLGGLQEFIDKANQ